MSANTTSTRSATPIWLARNRAWYAEQFTAFGALIEQSYGAELSMAPRSVIVAIQCLGLGLIDQYTRTPDEITDEVVFAAFDALADGAIRRP